MTNRNDRLILALCAALLAAQARPGLAQTRFGGPGAFRPAGVPAALFQQHIENLIGGMDWTPSASLDSLKSLEALTKIEPLNSDDHAEAEAARALHKILSEPGTAKDRKAALVEAVGPETARRVLEAAGSVQVRLASSNKREEPLKPDPGYSKLVSSVKDWFGRREAPLPDNVIRGPWKQGPARRGPWIDAEGAPANVLVVDFQSKERVLPMPKPAAKARREERIYRPAPEQKPIPVVMGKVLKGPWKARPAEATAHEPEPETPGKVIRVPFGDPYAVASYRWQLRREKQDRIQANIDRALAQAAEAKAERERRIAEEKAHFNLDFSQPMPEPKPQMGKVLPFDASPKKPARVEGSAQAEPGKVIQGPWGKKR